MRYNLYIINCTYLKYTVCFDMCIYKYTHMYTHTCVYMSWIIATVNIMSIHLNPQKFPCAFCNLSPEHPSLTLPEHPLSGFSTLSIMILRFTHAVACINSLLLVLMNISLYGYATIRLSLPLSVGIWFGSSFWLLHVNLWWKFFYKFSCEHMFTFLSGNLGVKSLDHMMMCIFNCSINGQTLFQNGCTSYQHRTRVLVPQHPQPYLFILVILIKVWCVWLWR